MKLHSFPSPSVLLQARKNLVRLCPAATLVLEARYLVKIKIL